MSGTCSRLSNVAGYAGSTADSGQLKRDGLPTTNKLSALTTVKACPVKKEHSTKPSILACHALPPLRSTRRSSSRSPLETTTVTTMRKTNGGLTSVSVMNYASGMMVAMIPCHVFTDGSVGCSSSFPVSSHICPRCGPAARGTRYRRERRGPGRSGRPRCRQC
jgi:hypothetical protein